MTIYSVGYGGRTLDELAELLKGFCITHLVDVRTSPFSKFAVDFNRDVLQERSVDLGFKYVFMGAELGGRPDCRECYDQEGRVLYEVVSSQEFFRKGIRQLLKGAAVEGRRLCLLCSERKPEECHRSKLIGEALTGESVELAHINEKGQLLDQAQVMSRVSQGQVDLFDEAHRTSRKTYGGSSNQ